MYVLTFLAEYENGVKNGIFVILASNKNKN